MSGKQARCQAKESESGNHAITLMQNHAKVTNDRVQLYKVMAELFPQLAVFLGLKLELCRQDCKGVRRQHEEGVEQKVALHPGHLRRGA